MSCTTDQSQIQAALRTAAQNGDAKTLRTLLDVGGNVNHRYDTHQGETLLHVACCCQHVEIVKILLEYGADVTKSTTDENITAVHIAAITRNAKLLDELVDPIADSTKHVIDAKTIIGDTALHFAAQKDFLLIIKYLMIFGATYNIKNDFGVTPKDISKRGNCYNFFQFVDQLFEDVKNGDNCVVSRIKSLTYTERRAVMSTRNIKGETLLNVSEKYNHKEIVNDLLVINEDFEFLWVQPNQLEGFYLFKREIEYWAEPMKILQGISHPIGSKKNKFPTVADKIGSELLHTAINLVSKFKQIPTGKRLNEHLKVIEDTLNSMDLYPIDPDTAECERKYMKLLKGTHKDGIRLFLNLFENGIYLPAKVLIGSVQKSLHDIYSELFLRYSEDHDFEGLIVLFKMAKSVFLVDILLNTDNLGKDDVSNLQKYADCDEITAKEIGFLYANSTYLHLMFNSRDYEGSTAIHFLAKYGSLYILRFLLQEGASYNMKDYQGRTPIDVTSSDKGDVFNFLTLVDDIFNNINAGGFKVIEQLKNLNEDDFLAVTNARDQEGKTLISILLTNANGDYGKDSEKILKELIKLLKH